MEIPSAYFLNSTADLEIDSELFRTEGSHQIQQWVNFGQRPKIEKIISSRRYFNGTFAGKRFFAKEFVEPNYPGWTIEESVQYQFESLLILLDVPSVPTPLFYSPTMLGIEYVDGESIKGLAMTNRFTAAKADLVIPKLESDLSEIESRLKAVGRRYDASFNNVLIDDADSIHFVDFDYVGPGSWKHNLIVDTRRLAAGEIHFDDSGKLQDPNRNSLRARIGKILTRIKR